MPTYDYKCNGCGHVFELLHGMGEDPDPHCPQCGTGSQRLISGGAGVLFKGSGFYATDNGSARNPRCGRDGTCCGREVPCEVRPCED